MLAVWKAARRFASGAVRAALVLGVLALGTRWAFLAILLILMLARGGWTTLGESAAGIRERSYFGVYTVRQFDNPPTRVLSHGTTIHGRQFLDPERRDTPTSYYGPTSGVGLALSAADAIYGDNAQIGVIGLGTGTLACYREPGQRYTFYEIDPMVVDYSRNGVFTYLSDCAPDAQIHLGDARLELEAEPAQQYDILAVDAFSSDAIPLHLLTSEAIGIYARAMKPDGILLIHISNRFFGLEPVLAAEAKARGWAAAIRMDPGPASGSDFDDLTASNWVALTATPDRMQQLTGGIRPRDQAFAEGAWVPLEARANFERWTDDYASTLPVLLWDHIIGKRDE